MYDTYGIPLGCGSVKNLKNSFVFSFVYLTGGGSFQPGDGESDITAEEQWDITEKAILEFVDFLSL